MAGTSIAVIGYFRSRQTSETLWQRAIAPALAALGLLTIAGLIAFNFESLLGPAAPASLKVVLPGLILLAALAGGVWGIMLRQRRPDVYAGIGRGGGNPAGDDNRARAGAHALTSGGHGGGSAPASVTTGDPRPSAGRRPESSDPPAFRSLWT